MFEQILYDAATARLSLLFDALDIDNSSSLAKPELVSFARSIDPAEDEQLVGFWKVLNEEADADQDGRIARDEWINFWNRRWEKCGRTDYPLFDATIIFFESIAAHAQNRRVEELFRHLDADGSGEITKKELIQWIMVLPPKYRASRSSCLCLILRACFTFCVHVLTPHTSAPLHALVWTPTGFICVKLRKGMDTNGDGAITLDEWHSYWKAAREAGDIEEDIMWFKVRCVLRCGGTRAIMCCFFFLYSHLLFRFLCFRKWLRVDRRLRFVPCRGAAATFHSSSRGAIQSGPCQENRWGDRIGRHDPLGCRRWRASEVQLLDAQRVRSLRRFVPLSFVFSRVF